MATGCSRRRTVRRGARHSHPASRRNSMHLRRTLGVTSIALGCAVVLMIASAGQALAEDRPVDPSIPSLSQVPVAVAVEPPPPPPGPYYAAPPPGPYAPAPMYGPAPMAVP